MLDPRVEKLARTIIGYSVKLQPGENILINCTGPATDLAAALVREAYAAGGHPFVNMIDSELERELMRGITAEQLKAMAAWDSARMSQMQAYVGIWAPENMYILGNVPPENNVLWNTLYTKPVHFEIRIPKTKWVVLRYPTPGMAQAAGVSTAAFEDFLFNVCTLDYSKMSRAMDPLADLMSRTDRVRLVGPGETDLSFSIKGIPSIKCAGEMNLPDGEIYTAPVRDSVNGVIAYNTPSTEGGFRYENIRFTFRDGKIVEATANNTQGLNQILDTDEGARYLGEFAMGVNPYVLKPMDEALFDEKIAGSIHLTPGAAYDDAFNGNKSAVHWDLVMIQRPEYGGGEIWFDGRLIRKDGRFVIPELEGLNPENLVEK